MGPLTLGKRTLGSILAQLLVRIDQICSDSSVIEAKAVNYPIDLYRDFLMEFSGNLRGSYLTLSYPYGYSIKHGLLGKCHG